MIFTERTITVVNDSATINKPLILYRGDKNIELKITIAESQFKFRNTDASNVIETTDASYAQLVINTPYNSPIFSDVAVTKNGAVIFVITEAMIDEIREVGAYEIQIRLLDDNKQSRASIPPVSNAIEIREPIAIEDGSAVDSNAVNVAKVNRALTTTSAPLEAFDSQGNYIKKTWGDGDPITDAALNKIETAIDGVNKKIGNVNSQIKDIKGKNNIDYTTTILPANIFEKISVWNALGDSITAGMSTTKIYHEYIKQQYTNITVNNYGISGTEICKGGTYGNQMCVRYADMADDADLITVFAGVNDFLHNAPIGEFSVRDDATFYGGVRTLIEGLIQKYPYKFIYFLTPLKVRIGKYGVNTDGTNNLGLTLDAYINVIKECCNYYGIPCIDTNNISTLNPNWDFVYTNYVPDGLHPNAYGHLRLAKSLTYVAAVLDTPAGSGGSAGSGSDTPTEPPTITKGTGTPDTTTNLYTGEMFQLNGKHGYYSDGGTFYADNNIKTAYIPVTPGETYQILDNGSTITEMYINFFKDGKWIIQALGSYTMSLFELPSTFTYDHIGIASMRIPDWGNLTVYGMASSI